MCALCDKFSPNSMHECLQFGSCSRLLASEAMHHHMQGLGYTYAASGGKRFKSHFWFLYLLLLRYCYVIVLLSVPLLNACHCFKLTFDKNHLMIPKSKRDSGSDRFKYFCYIAFFHDLGPH